MSKLKGLDKSYDDYILEYVKKHRFATDEELAVYVRKETGSKNRLLRLYLNHRIQKMTREGILGKAGVKRELWVL
jgi:hypothetical protein